MLTKVHLRQMARQLPGTATVSRFLKSASVHGYHREADRAFGALPRDAVFCVSGA